MSDQTDNILSLVKPYGLSSEEGIIYLFLLEHGFSTALVMSKKLHMGRTKVYRLLDRLKEKQLVEYAVDERGMKFGATSPEKFRQLVVEKEHQAQSLRQSLPALMQHLQGLSVTNRSESKVLYYEGIEGLKQVSYNITRTRGVLRVLEMEHMSDFIDEESAEEIRRELVENKILTRDLTNKKSFPGFTEVAELVAKNSQYRYIDPQRLQINFEVLIYNDVYATYTYKDEQIFCVEIYNEQLAEMQKQLFDFIWGQAQPMKFVDKRGGARVK